MQPCRKDTLEEVIDGKLVSRTEVATLDRPGHLESLGDLGLRLADAKPMLASILTAIVTHQIRQDAERQSSCPDCGKGRQVKDYRIRRFDTLFGRTEVRVPRFVCPTPGCAGAIPEKTANNSRLLFRSAPAPGPAGALCPALLVLQGLQYGQVCHIWA